MITHLSIHDREAVGKATNFFELSLVALKIVRREHCELTQVCGPITSGSGSVRENLRKFARAIYFLHAMGHNVFSQLPFERRLYELTKVWQKTHGNIYCQPILDEFYKPIFESRFIVKAFFLPGWQESIGAAWEHRIMMDLGIRIDFFAPPEMRKIGGTDRLKRTFQKITPP